jgi:hypothetical protein
MHCGANIYSISMAMRRPNMLRFSSWIQDCLETISNNPNVTKLDKSIVHNVKLLKISEDIFSAFMFDDPSNMPDLPESRLRLMMSGFERQLEAWKKGAELNERNGTFPSMLISSILLTNIDSLLFQYYTIQIYLHEVALYDDHPPEDFVPPMRLSKVFSIHTLPGATGSFVEASAISIASAQGLLDILLNMDINSLRALPIGSFVRVIVALVILIKLYISSKSPTSKVGSVLDRKSIKLDFYLEAVSNKLIEATGQEQFRAPFTFLGIIMRLRMWHEGQKDHELFTIPQLNNDILPEYECWMPPVPKGEWDANFGKLSNGSNGTAYQKDWSWNIEPEPLKDMDLNDAAGLTLAPSMQADMVPTIDDIPYDYTENGHGYNETMLMDGFQYDTAPPDWVPSMDLPNLDHFSQTNFEWHIQGDNEPFI